MTTSDPRTDLPAITRAGWQCPECRTVYSPDVRSCTCAARPRSLSERIQSPAIRLGSGCTCTPSGVGTVPCPVHRTETVRVTC